MNRVTVVGAGALGSHVILFLRSAGYLLGAIDFDRVEQKNVLSQFHARSSVGKSKVQSIKQTMDGLFGVKLDIVPHRLIEENVSQLLLQADLVIDCLDNAKSRKIVRDHCLKTSTPCLHGALDGAGSFGRVVWAEQFAIDEEGQAGAATCENGEHLPFIAMTAAYIARSAQVFLKTGQKKGFSIHPAGAILS